MRKLLLSSLILTTLCGRLCWSVSSDRLAVIQSPDITVMEGETVNISCCWTWKIETVWVFWLKNGIVIQDQVWQNKSQESLKKDTNNCFPLTFPNIRRNDSGRYICKAYVRKPPLMSVQGNGTLVTLVALKSPDYNSDYNTIGDAVLPEVCIYMLVFLLSLVTPLCCLF